MGLLAVGTPADAFFRAPMAERGRVRSPHSPAHPQFPPVSSPRTRARGHPDCDTARQPGPAPEPPASPRLSPCVTSIRPSVSPLPAPGPSYPSPCGAAHRAGAVPPSSAPLCPRAAAASPGPGACLQPHRPGSRQGPGSGLGVKIRTPH